MVLHYKKAVAYTRSVFKHPQCQKSQVKSERKNEKGEATVCMFMTMFARRHVYPRHLWSPLDHAGGILEFG